MKVGIEALNIYAGTACLDVRTLFQARGLSLDRFDNLMMEKKSVALPCEDAVTNAVNAAKPIVEQMSDEERNSIDLVITATESGLDFGKSLSTYVHDYLKLSRNCRLFEVKQACYGGTAALHMAAGHIASHTSPTAKALVIATDTARTSMKMDYFEPTQATGAVALLVSDKPEILELDRGANGYYSYEVMDACRPDLEIETGDSDLTLLSYLDCLENSFLAYTDKVDGADFKDTFDYLVFHTPFAGMVKGAHRKLMRQFKKATPDQIEVDFQNRVMPSVRYSMQVGNVYSASAYLALTSLIDHADHDGFKRVGIFSYGSGCSSEFFSGVLDPAAKRRVKKMDVGNKLRGRYGLEMQEYDMLMNLHKEWLFGTKDKATDVGRYSKIYERSMDGRGLLVVDKVENFHRQYRWS